MNNDRSPYQGIVERISDGIILADRQTQCLYLNPAAERILDTTLAKASGRPIWEVTEAVVGTAFREAQKRLLEGEPVQLLHSYFTRGRWYDAEASLGDEGVLVVFRDTTDRLQAAAAQRQSEERFRLLVDGIKDHAIILLDLSGHVVTWNQGAQRITGYPRDEILGKHYSVLNPPGDARPGRPGRDLEVAMREPFSEWEGWRKRRDGSPYHANVLMTALRDERGEPCGFAKVTRDTTARKVAEEALRVSEAKLAGIISIAADAIICIDGEQRITIFNDGAQAIFGYTRDEILGQPLDLLMPERFRERHREHVHRLTAGAPTARKMGQRDLSIRGRRSSGEEFPAEAAISKLEVAGSSVLTVILRDVTEQRRMEAAVRDRERRWRLAIDSAELGSWDYSVQSQTLIADDRCKALFGLSPDEEVDPEVLLGRIHPEDRQCARDHLREALECAGSEEIALEGRILVGGGQRWVHSKGKVFRNEAGTPVCLLGAIRDTTAHHQVEEIRERLTGIFAHDLRSPVSAISMAAAALLQRGTLAEPDRRTVAVMGRCADRMAHMIEQLLDFTRVRFGGGMPIRREHADLRSLAREVVLETELAHLGREIRIEELGDCTGMWDPIRLGEVLSNLLGNALQHGCPGSPVDVVLRAEEDQVVLEVHNLGEPIPAKLLPVIFDPFRQGTSDRMEETTRGKGLGLGLHITREIVLAHGGELTVRSTAAQGTTFTVRLPRALQGSAAGPSPHAER
jgi:PAS domain S-box-containing protein